MIQSDRFNNITATNGNLGPLAQKVLDYSDTVRRLVPKIKTASDWAPLADFVAIDKFERIGTFMEVQNWYEYTEMMTQWAAATSKFETVLRRISELPQRVLYEIEEQHFHGDRIDIVNSMTVFEFNNEGKINHLDVYLQQPRR